MESFLERYYEQVNRELGDPPTSNRLTKAQKLADFYSIEAVLYENLLSATGHESLIGRTEVFVNFTEGVDTYRFPENYRNYLSLEKRQADNPDIVLARLRTITEFHPGPGVLLLGARKAFKIRPAPSIDSTNEWTLTYQRLWGRIHYGRCSIPHARALVHEGPMADGAGELVRRANYYRGAQINVYGGVSGIPQQNTVDSSSEAGVFSFVHPWDPLPKGDADNPLMYEVLPTIPYEHEQLYAVEAAIRNSPRRHNEQWQNTVAATQQRLWNACLSHFSKATTERPSQAILPPEDLEVDPYSQYN